MKRTKLLTLNFAMACCLSSSAQVLNITETFQEQDKWCWAGTSSAMLNYHYHPVSQCEVAEYTRSVAQYTNYGTVNCCVDPLQGCNQPNFIGTAPGSVYDIMAHFAGLGSTVMFAPVTPVLFDDEIQHNRPIFIRWLWPNAEGHALVGHGISGNDVYYMDPWPGEGLMIADYDWMVQGSLHIWSHTLILHEAPVSHCNQELLLEDFTGIFPPGGWSFYQQASNWSAVNSSIAGGQAPEARLNWSPQFNGLTMFVSPVINLQGYDSIRINFRHALDDYGGGYMIGLATRSGNSANWNSAWLQNVTASIPATSQNLVINNTDTGQEDFQFCFFFNGNSYNMNYWYIDDVKLQTWCRHDVMCDSVTVPPQAKADSLITIKAIFSNKGTYAESFPAHCEIRDASDSLVWSAQLMISNLLPNASTEVTFPACPGVPASMTYQVKIWCHADPDFQRRNDTITREMNTYILEMEHMLLELATATECTGCPGPILASQDLISNGQQVAVIDYRFNDWDPLFNVCSDERTTFYAIQLYPTSYFNGDFQLTAGSGSNLYSLFLAIYNAIMLWKSPIELQMEGLVAGNQYTAGVSVKLHAPLTKKSLSLIGILTESDIPYVSNGQDTIDNLARMLINGSAGEPLIFDGTDSLYLSLDFVPDSGLVDTNCTLIVFVQDVITMKVYQVIQMPLKDFMHLENDIGVSAFVEPSQCPGSASPVEVKVKIRNFGSDPQISFPLSFSLNNGAWHTDTIHDTLLAGSEMIHIFQQQVALPSPGAFHFKVFTGLASDQNHGNDTLVRDFACTIPVYKLCESFEGDSFPPPGWTRASPDGGTGWMSVTVGTAPLPGWSGGSVTAVPNDTGGVKMAYASWTTGGSASNEQWLITPMVSSIIEGDTLSFWVRKTPAGFADSLLVKLSATNTQLSSFDTVLLDIGWPDSFAGWQRYKLDLSPWAGQQVSIAFIEHIWDNYNEGAAVMIDLVKIGQEMLTGGSVIQGTLTYDNTTATPLNNAHIVLLQNGQAVDEVISGNAGEFSFSVSPGTYSLDAYCNIPWGGGNSIDALLIMKHFVGTDTLEGIRLEAADVDNSTYVNAIDALLVMKRFVGLLASFGAGDWIFTKPEFYVPSSANYNQPMKGLCTGDVNASHVLPADKK